MTGCPRAGASRGPCWPAPPGSTPPARAWSAWTRPPGGALIRWIHTALGAVAAIPWNPKRQKHRSRLPPTWTPDGLGKRASIERFFGRVFPFFYLQRPPLTGWSAVAARVALTYAGVVIVAIATADAGRPDLIRSPSASSPTLGRAPHDLGNTLSSVKRSLGPHVSRVTMEGSPTLLGWALLFSPCGRTIGTRYRAENT